MSTKLKPQVTPQDKFAARIQRECLVDKLKSQVKKKKDTQAPSRTPLQSRAQTTIDEILLATVRILVRDGYDELNTNHIAAEADISVSTLYQYFADKSDVLEALIKIQSELLVSRFEKGVADHAAKPLPDAVQSLITLMFEIHRSDTRLFSLLRRQIPSSEQFNLLDRALDRIAELLTFALKVRQQEIPSVDYKRTGFLMTYAFIGIIDAALKQNMSDSEYRDLTSATAEMSLAFLNSQR
ncbi:MAG: TetR/AcrR family transcriptional regulator [Proteobacteria bacterium]|nr:TetR/AcrR family transcriptional regulator [Pseudomonadota bacterium]